MRFRQWPARNYLLRMAESPDEVTRKRVVEALKNVASSNHPDIHHDGMEILATLPPEESAQLADMAVGRLGREARFSFLQAPEKLVKKPAEAGQQKAALQVARAPLQIWDQNGEIASLHGRHMHEHHLPSIMSALNKTGGEGALRLVVELLNQSATIGGEDSYGCHSSNPIASDEQAKYNNYEALLSAVRRSAKRSSPTTPRA
jgi:hypothetical protein